MTRITITGNLVDDPALKFTPSGAAVTNFTVAVNKREKDPATGEWKDGAPSYYRCAAWRQLAENVTELAKGQRVIVTGDLEIRAFERPDGSKGISPEIRVSDVGPSLLFAGKRPATPTPAPAAASTAAAWDVPADSPF